MKKIVLLFSLLLSCTLAFSQAYYLDPGKSIPTDDRKGIPVLSFSIDNTSQTATMVLELGTASAALFDAVISGTYFKKMELKSYDAKDKVEFSFVFSGVLLTSIQLTGGTTESLTLSFSKVNEK